MHENLSFSQCGEDRIVDFIFKAAGVTMPCRYLDIGGAYPNWHNNTFLLYVKGGTGVVVEADGKYAEMYASMRDRDVLIEAACVGSARDTGTIDFFISSDAGWSSISIDHVREAERLGKGPLVEQKSVPTTNINRIFSEHFEGQEVALLSIDVEGADLEILDDLDTSRFRPKVIVTENTKDEAAVLEELMRRKDYVFFATTYLNSIYVERGLSERMAL